MRDVPFTPQKRLASPHRRPHAQAVAKQNIIKFFAQWIRFFFEIDEDRLRGRLYLHEDLDLDALNRFWSEMVAIPLAQFGKPDRAVADLSRKRSKHVHGCFTITYCCSHTARKVLGYMDGLLKSTGIPG